MNATASVAVPIQCSAMPSSSVTYSGMTGTRMVTPKANSAVAANATKNVRGRAVVETGGRLSGESAIECTTARHAGAR